jgi:hypothetical protein
MVRPSTANIDLLFYAFFNVIVYYFFLKETLEMVRMKLAAFSQLALVCFFVSGCGDAPKNPSGEPGIESKGSLDNKGIGNASRPAPPAPPPIQPVK